jgi:hypothetical protein
VSDSGIPQWRSWYRWPFLLAFLMGAAMLVVGVRECLTLAEALRTLPPTIVVNTAMSAFPPLGIGIMAAGLLGWLPRKADGSGLCPIRTRRGGERDPGAIVVAIVLAMLLLYPVAGLTLRVVTADRLSAHGYTDTTERVSASSGYLTTRWTR